MGKGQEESLNGVSSGLEIHPQRPEEMAVMQKAKEFIQIPAPSLTGEDTSGELTNHFYRVVRASS